MDTHSLKYGCTWMLGRLYCSMHGIKFSHHFRPYGFPVISRHSAARITLGEHVVLNSNPRVNLAGIVRKVTLVALSADSEIIIGDHTGLSGAVIYAARSVRIGNHVDIGINTLIYDTDFHPVNWQARRGEDSSQVAVSPVVIEDDVWIGGDCIILKGVHIGRRAIIAAGSVINRDIPENTVWGGNPVKFIKNIA